MVMKAKMNAQKFFFVRLDCKQRHGCLSRETEVENDNNYELPGHWQWRCDRKRGKFCDGFLSHAMCNMCWRPLPTSHIKSQLLWVSC